MSIFIVKNSYGQEVIWQEDFDGYSESISTAPGKWTGADKNNFYAKVQTVDADKVLTIYANSRKKVKWITEAIDISDYMNIEVVVNGRAFGSNSWYSSDLIIEYSYDNDKWFTIGTVDHWYDYKYKDYVVNSLNGNNIYIRAKLNSKSEAGEFYISNVLIRGIKKDKVLWLRADKGVAPSGGLINIWNDQSDYGNDAFSSYSLDKTNDYNSSSINYNPGVSFKSINKSSSNYNGKYMKVNDDLSLKLAYFSIFSVVKPQSTEEYDAIVSKHNSSYDSGYGLHYFPDGNSVKMIVNFDDPYDLSDGVYPLTLVNSKPQLIGGMYNGTTLSVFTESNYNGKSYNKSILNNNSPLTLGGDHTSEGSISIFDGDINEVLIYNYAVSDEEKDMIESYLAIKYGITLKHDYKFFNGQVIYTCDSYNQDIAGIGTVGGWNLEQKISSTINKTNSDGSNIIISTENDFTGPNNNISTSLSNGQALVCGKNNGSTDTWIDDGKYKKTNECWKVQNTGGVGNVYLQINLSNYNSYNYDFYLVVDTDNNLSNGVDCEHLLTDLGSDRYQTEVNFPSGVSYMTVVLKCANPKRQLSVSLPDNLNVCEGDNLDITATAVGGSGNYSYNFYVKTTSDSDFKDTPDQNSNNDTFPHVYSVTSDLKVIITDELGCVCTPVIKPVTVGAKIQTKEIARKK